MNHTVVLYFMSVRLERFLYCVQIADPRAKQKWLVHNLVPVQYKWNYWIFAGFKQGLYGELYLIEVVVKIWSYQKKSNILWLLTYWRNVQHYIRGNFVRFLQHSSCITSYVRIWIDCHRRGPRLIVSWPINHYQQ